ncbi:hypothetical protein AMTRI_Chr12g266920 [Amborella trichopoda]|uniref:APO domain-containing protein n=1 Tax=Amborella trichopoda TaxID=13333 RepID=W1NUX1_AMBTC|nr:APO protein 4, mitochondrial [Amborella trichopoda]XP_020518804.1 APO protein 4, mitochondrial [Amborella trichopoda]XP_020518805.1 APO protein 4, mitochondrial [Amborella trichopoda]ERM99402.1 hypothetical protein AMTR_s00131p00039570 [Amborella trichopoda]|eukprot:XP_006836549.1 APO protein 4, mitochondrial [Amborella trichopoda]
MAWKQRVQVHVSGKLYNCLIPSRCYKSKAEWQKLRPMILERLRSRAKDYPVRNMVPVANDVLKARGEVVDGVSTLIKFIPVKACKFCSEVYVGEEGHQIRTCCGYRRGAKKQLHRWINGGFEHILVPVDAYHLRTMFQDVIKHDERFDYERIPAVLELCDQAGASISSAHDNHSMSSNGLNHSHSHSHSGDGLSLIIEQCNQTVADISKTLHNFSSKESSHDLHHSNGSSSVKSFGDLVGLPEELQSIAQRTLDAWERMRLGIKKLMLVYPVKVCKYCGEVHVGPSGHKVRLCGLFRHEPWRGGHFWKKADLDDLVPPQVVWHRRPQDPCVLLDNGRSFYGHAPAVVELCAQGGATVPTKYFCMMKNNGLVPR